MLFGKNVVLYTYYAICIGILLTFALMIPVAIAVESFSKCRRAAARLWNRNQREGRRPLAGSDAPMQSNVPGLRGPLAGNASEPYSVTLFEADP
jgi:hypothetical protein